MNRIVDRQPQFQSLPSAVKDGKAQLSGNPVRTGNNHSIWREPIPAPDGGSTELEQARVARVSPELQALAWLDLAGSRGNRGVSEQLEKGDQAVRDLYRRSAIKPVPQQVPPMPQPKSGQDKRFQVVIGTSASSVRSRSSAPTTERSQSAENPAIDGVNQHDDRDGGGGDNSEEGHQQNSDGTLAASSLYGIHAPSSVQSVKKVNDDRIKVDRHLDLLKQQCGTLFSRDPASPSIRETLKAGFAQALLLADPVVREPGETLNMRTLVINSIRDVAKACLPGGFKLSLKECVEALQQAVGQLGTPAGQSATQETLRLLAALMMIAGGAPVRPTGQPKFSAGRKTSWESPV